MEPSLKEKVEDHKAKGEIAELMHLRNEIGVLIGFVQDRVKEMIDGADPKALLKRSEKNLAQAQLNFAFIQ